MGKKTTILELGKEERFSLDILSCREKYFRNISGGSRAHFKAQVCIIYHSIKPPVPLKDVVRVLDMRDLHFLHICSSYMLIFRKDCAICCFCETHCPWGKDSQHTVQKVVCNPTKERSTMCL